MGDIEMPMRSHTLASVDGMVAVRMAQSVIADAQRAVRDRAIYKPQAPIRPRKKDKDKGKKPAGRSIGYSGGRWRPEPEPEALPNARSDGMRTDRGNVSRRYREARPWLSAREVRMRASEDMREREAMPVGSATKHTYSVAPKQGTRGERARRAPAQRIIDSRHVATMPREIRHIKRVALPPVEKAVQEKDVDTFGQGDRVRLAQGHEKLAFGQLAGWKADPDTIGTVMMGGKRWKGDCLVEMGGQRLWLKCEELEMVEMSDKPRPTTAEELRALNKRRAAERKKRAKAARLAQVKWQAKMGGEAEGFQEDVLETEEIVSFFEEIDDDGSGLLDRDELKKLLEKLGKVVTEEVLSTAMQEMDRDDSGQVDLSEFLQWWRKAGAEARAEMTRVADRMNQLREVFESMDADNSGSLDHEEITEMIAKHLGMKLKPAELEEALKQMDDDSSGEVSFSEFYAWWTKDETQATFQKAIKRMEAVKEVFDTLDEDSSGALSRKEVKRLADSLNAKLTHRDLDAAMREMDEDGDGEVDFMEFYSWWMASGDGVLQEAKKREQARLKMWSAQTPLVSTYNGSGSWKEVELKSSQATGKYKGVADGGAAGPRLRRCTVDQLFIAGGAGLDVDLDDLEDSSDEDYGADGFDTAEDGEKRESNAADAGKKANDANAPSAKEQATDTVEGKAQGNVTSGSADPVRPRAPSPVSRLPFRAPVPVTLLAPAQSEAGQLIILICCVACGSVCLCVCVSALLQKAGPSATELLRSLFVACETGEFTNHGTTVVEEMLDERDEDGAPLYNVNGSVRGVTPLMVAAGAGHHIVCHVLLANGADIHREDEDKLTALAWAMSSTEEHADVLELLRDHGAKESLQHDASAGNALAALALESKQRAADGTAAGKLRMERDDLLRAANNQAVKLSVARGGKRLLHTPCCGLTSLLAVEMLLDRPCTECTCPSWLPARCSVHDGSSRLT